MKTLHMNKWAVEHLLGHVDGVSFEEGTAKLEAIVKYGAEHLLAEIERFHDQTGEDLFQSHFPEILQEIAQNHKTNAVIVKSGVLHNKLTNLPYFSVLTTFELKAQQMLDGHHDWCDHEPIQEDIRGSYERITVCAKCGQEL